MKSKATKQAKVTYQAIEKNIYKVGKSFRVRANGFSGYYPNITQARKARKTYKKFKQEWTNESSY